MKTFKVLREIVIGDKTYFPDDTVKETDDRDWVAIERMGLVTSEVNSSKEDKVEPKETLTNPVKSGIKDRETPVIKQAGPAWMKVYVGDKMIGKAVRTREEAQEIIDEWLKENQ